ncbi:MAG: hypothetical protein ABR548_13655 [Actinomycetota bacterium]|nr:hypothetical protein [Actinomycetota bacterium]
MRRRIVFLFVVFAVVAAVFPARGSSGALVLYAGAARQDVTPFTNAPSVVLAPGSNPGASNPDGLPATATSPGGDAGLHDANLHEWMYATFDGQVTKTGVWGEPFTDSPGGRPGRFDDRLGNASRGADTFVDDPGNTAIDPDSAGKWDGTYLAGFANDRVATGALDKLWVRVAVFANAPIGADLQGHNVDAESFAIASADFLGYFSDWSPRILDLAESLWPYEGGGGEFWLNRLILSHTHNHAGPDVHVGMWGPNAGTDGTYPKYERYVERKIAIALVHAMRDARPVTIRTGSIGSGETFRTLAGHVESLAGLQARSSCRTPWFFDDELRALEARDARGRPVLAMINYAAHNESLEGQNTLLSSDFAGYARDELERRLGGGVAMWMPGAQGAVEIVGDSCTSRWKRAAFDGERFPSIGGRIPYGPARTRAIGRLIGDAAYAALSSGAVDARPLIEGFAARTLDVPVTNEALAALSAKGVIDKPAYVAEKASANQSVYEASGAAYSSAGAPIPKTELPSVPSPGTDARTTLYAFEIGPASFITAPGELFPEIYYGVGDFNRSKAAAYEFAPNSSYIECSGQAANGRPYEPSIRDRQALTFPGASVHFILGYTPDLLGSIVPGYDYSIYGAPVLSGAGVPLQADENGAAADEAPDDCAGITIAQALAGGVQDHYVSHHQEVNSASSMLAAAYACTIDAILLQDVTGMDGVPACHEWSTWKFSPARVHNPADHSTTSDMLDPESERIRHY